jgi:hypothetical protein
VSKRWLSKRTAAARVEVVKANTTNHVGAVDVAVEQADLMLRQHSVQILVRSKDNRKKGERKEKDRRKNIRDR